MKLGNSAFVSISSKDFISSSLLFFEKLGYQQVDLEKVNTHSTLLTDGFILIELFSGTENYSALSYSVDNLNHQIERLEKLNAKIIHQTYQEVIFFTPDNLRVRLVADDITRGHKPIGKPLSKCGRLFELSIEVADIDSAIEYWREFGFDVETRTSPTSTWASLNDGLIRLGIYLQGSCPHKFKNPSITYFEPDMSERIKLIQSAGINSIEELPDQNGKINDAIAESPDGQYIFLFYYEW